MYRRDEEAHRFHYNTESHLEQVLGNGELGTQLEKKEDRHDFPEGQWKDHRDCCNLQLVSGPQEQAARGGGVS